MRIRKLLRELLSTSAQAAKAAGVLIFEALPAFEIETPKIAEHGDFAANLAMLLAPGQEAPIGNSDTSQTIRNAALGEWVFMLQYVKVSAGSAGNVKFRVCDFWWKCGCHKDLCLQSCCAWRQ